MAIKVDLASFSVACGVSSGYVIKTCLESSEAAIPIAQMAADAIIRINFIADDLFSKTKVTYLPTYVLSSIV